MSIDKRGHNNYRFRITHKGTKYDTTFYGTEKQAKEAHESFKFAVKSGRIEEVQQQKESSMTLREVWGLYIESKGLSYGTELNHKYHMQNFKPLLDLPVKDITKMQMLQYYNNNKHFQADNDYRNLRAVLNFAVDLEIIEKNPLSFKLKSRSIKKFETLLSEEEVKKLIDYLSAQSDVISLFCLTQILLGTRYGETAGITKASIDTSNHTVKIDKQYKSIDTGTKGIGELKTKTSERVIPIPLMLRGGLYPRLLKVPPMGYVFAYTGSNPPSILSVLNRLTVICQELGLKRLTSHDLRRLSATIAIYSGMDMFSVARLLGHGSTTMTENYIKELKGKKEQEASKIDDYLKNLS